MIKILLRVVFFGLGLTLLCFLIQKFGAEELLGALRQIGWKIIYILMIPPLWLAIQTAAWKLTVAETGDHITFGQLFKIKMGGDAFNTLTPLGFIGGDPVRFALLKQKMPGSLSAASIVLDRTMQILAVVTLLIISLIPAAFVLSLPTAWQILFPIMTVGIASLLYFFIHHQQKGLFERLFLKLHKLGIKKNKIESLLEHLRSTDESISQFYRHNPRRFLTVYACHFMGRVLGVVEIFLIAFLLKINLSWMGALFMASLAVLVNILFTFIPGSMGVLEGAYGALALLMGLSPIQGVAIQVVRRLRALFWISLGISYVIWGYKRQ